MIKLILYDPALTSNVTPNGQNAPGHKLRGLLILSTNVDLVLLFIIKVR